MGDGQKVFLIESTGTPWTLKIGHILYMKDNAFLLTVTGTDQSGNSATEVAEPDFRGWGRGWPWR